MNGDGSILLALGALCVSGVATVLPQVRDPWPDTIGLDFPFTLAGACSVILLVTAVATDRPKRVRDQWARQGLSTGFVLGVSFYLLALGAQVFSVRI